MQTVAGVFASWEPAHMTAKSSVSHAESGKAKDMLSSVDRSLSYCRAGQGNRGELRQGLCSSVWFLFSVFQFSPQSHQNQGAGSAQRPHENSAPGGPWEWECSGDGHCLLSRGHSSWELQVPWPQSPNLPWASPWRHTRPIPGAVGKPWGCLLGWCRPAQGAGCVCKR